jgi:hypothetical protein
MIEHFASHRDQFFSVMPFADGILCTRPAPRLYDPLLHCLRPCHRTHFWEHASIFCEVAVRILALDGEGDLPGESAPRSHQHISEITFRATGVSAVEGW